jgi:hypothetical protein
MARVRAPWPAMGVLIGDGTEGERGDAARGHGWGARGRGSARGAGGCRRSSACSCSVVYVRKN